MNPKRWHWYTWVILVYFVFLFLFHFQGGPGAWLNSVFACAIYWLILFVLHHGIRALAGKPPQSWG
jgi:hypothetical protein